MTVVSRVVVQEVQSLGRVAKPLADRSGAPRAATAAIFGRVGLSRPATPDIGPTTMTDDKIALRQMLEQGSGATFLREMIGFAAQRLMGKRPFSTALRRVALIG